MRSQTSTVVVVQLLNCVQLFVTPMDCSPLGSSVHGVFQARILGWVATSFFPTQESNPGLLHCRQVLFQLSYKGSPNNVVDKSKGPKVRNHLSYKISI